MCDKHFYPEDFSPSSRRLLKKGVIPSRFLPGSFEQVPEDLDTPGKYLPIAYTVYGIVDMFNLV